MVRPAPSRRLWAGYGSRGRRGGPGPARRKIGPAYGRRPREAEPWPATGIGRDPCHTLACRWDGGTRRQQERELGREGPETVLPR